MARIRSVHPGLWTDEDFVSMSPTARLLAIGIWTECDDQGVFPWKPVQLRMRLFPADDVSINGLLEELANAGMIRRFEANGSQFAAVRNFRKFQRPDKPNAIHPLPDDIAAYVGIRSTTHTGSTKKSPPYGGEEASTDRGEIADHSPTAPRPFPDQSGKVGADGEERRGEEDRESTSCSFAHARDADADLLGHPPAAAATQKPQPAKAKRQTFATAIDPAWKPDTSDIAFASSKEVADIPAEAERFVSHHLAKGTSSKNWAASWRTWCLNDVKFRQERGARMTSAPRTITPNGQPAIGGMMACAQRIYDKAEQDELNNAA